jgi:serine/threonine-protein kinase
MGSYLVVLKLAGYRDLRYPVFISRYREWAGQVRLFAPEQIPAGFLHVPAGPFLQGGESPSLTWSLPRAELALEDFFITEHPVTIAEYLEFLNSLVETRPDEAHKRTPRRGPESGTYLATDARGRFVLPEVDAEGDEWHPRWPVIGVSWYDAAAYCDWRAARERRRIRLPTDCEWEKAARGVDGRAFPWGNRYDASLANMKDSRRERPAPTPVDDFPTDVSPYGVRGMAGNVRDWTGMEADAGEATTSRAYFIIRGGCWGFGPTGDSGHFRFGASPTLVDGQLGFRLACTP